MNDPAKVSETVAKMATSSDPSIQVGKGEDWMEGEKEDGMPVRLMQVFALLLTPHAIFIIYIPLPPFFFHDPHRPSSNGRSLARRTPWRPSRTSSRSGTTLVRLSPSFLSLTVQDAINCTESNSTKSN